MTIYSPACGNFTSNWHQMIVFPGAKINIGLRITERRPDGYHNIETVFYPVNLHDALEFVCAEELKEDELYETGKTTGAAGKDNLVVKAAMKLREIKEFPFLKIHLHKTIPSGAGLGGGSSDAACLLKVVNRSFSLDVGENKLKELALSIGSDCPFFLRNTPAHATGRGEILEPAENMLSGHYLVIVNPRLHISTKEAYSACTPAKPSHSLSELVKKPVTDWKDNILNDFEDFAISMYPLIGQLKAEMYNSGALFSLMSGSGSSVFGIFSRKPDLPKVIRDYVIYQGEV
jgi:4-diphosphocytidyl-2-C-methyl-D-erythritol kinase